MRKVGLILCEFPLLCSYEAYTKSRKTEDVVADLSKFH
jgi:hypothetical protein